MHVTALSHAALAFPSQTVFGAASQPDEADPWSCWNRAVLPRLYGHHTAPSSYSPATVYCAYPTLQPRDVPTQLGP